MFAKCVLLAAVALLLGPAPFSAQAFLGQQASSRVAEVGTASLAFPHGEWQQIGVVDEQAKMNGGGSSQLPIRTHAYMQTQDGKLSALLVVVANITPNIYGWAPAPMCARTDVYWNEHANAWTKNFDCVLVNHVVMREGSATSAFWRGIYQAATPLGGMPKQLILAEFSDAAATNEIGVSVYLNADLAGLPPSASNWNESEWHPGNLDQRHKAYLDRVVAWAKLYRPAVRAAMP